MRTTLIKLLDMSLAPASIPCWLAIRLPHLALDLHTRGHSGRETAVAVSRTVQGRERITDCNAAALAGGISPGMVVTAAHSILEELQVIERNPAAEQQALERLAAWCYQYSSQVCLLPERAGLLLEAGASERLFGKAEQLGGRLVRDLGQIGYHAVGGSAATPEAAWLAAGEGWHLAAKGHIRQQLGPLALDRLYLDPALVRSMEQMGFRQLRDLLRLPRKSLTRRFGPGLPDYLDHLLGIRPDPRRFFEPPEHFSTRLELPAEIHTTEALLFPLKRLLGELCGVLRGGDTAVQSVQVTLGFEDHEDSLLELGLQSPAQDPERLLTVLRERLERLRLPAAVRAILLEAPVLLPFKPGQKTLFGDTPAEQEQGMEQLAERLQARLGERSVSGLAGVEDHRPEYSWRRRGLDEPADCTALAHRPTWLLPKPLRCRIENYQVVAGPERIESGWWDGRDCRRDYFIVRDCHGSLLWAFRAYKPRPGWYLHGIFA